MKSLACRLARATFLSVMLSPLLSDTSVSAPDAAAWLPSQLAILELSTNENARRSIWSSPALKSVIVSALAQIAVTRRHLASHQDTEPSRPVSTASEEIRESVQTALVRLPAKLQAVAVLAFLEERTHAEIAEMLDVPIGTVKSRVFRATRALRKELGRLGVNL